MIEVKITTVGSSLGVVLPKSLLAGMNVGKGDRLFVVETPTGIELSPYNAEVAEQLAVAERFTWKHRDVLKKLAE